MKCYVQTVLFKANKHWQILQGQLPEVQMLEGQLPDGQISRGLFRDK